MFCGNCGTQIPDGTKVCPNCGNPIPEQPAPQAPSDMTTPPPPPAPSDGNVPPPVPPAGQTPPPAAPTPPPSAPSSNTAKAKNKLPRPMIIGIAAVACILVVALAVSVILLAGGGAGGLKGTYTNGTMLLKFDGGRMTIDVYGFDMSMKYKLKKDEITFDEDSFTVSKDTFWSFLASNLDVDEDDLEDELEERAENDKDYEDLYEAYTSKKAKDLNEAVFDLMFKNQDLDDWEWEYDPDDNEIIDHEDGHYYYAENYKSGPSGKFTSKDDSDISITFNKGKAVFNDDGDKENHNYYVYEKDDKVYVLFKTKDYRESELYEYVGRASFELTGSKKFTFGKIKFKK